MIKYCMKCGRLMQENGIECCNYEHILSLFEIPVVCDDIDTLRREHLRLRGSIDKYIKSQQFADEYRTYPGRGKDVSKVGRNEPCPCGSGMKYKMCCGRGLW